METYKGIPVINDIRITENEEYKDIECKTILPASEREDDDDFWTQMYIEQYGNNFLNLKKTHFIRRSVIDIDYKILFK